MKKINLFTFFLFLNFASYAQERELETFRDKVYTYVNYDKNNNGKIKSIQLKKDKLLKELEKSFLSFILNEKSHNFDTIKKNATSIGKGIRCIEIRRDYSIKSKENNIDIFVDLSGIYDYDGQQSVSFYIQPFHIENEDYIVYYFKLNGKGKYYIKSLKNNKLLIESEAFSSKKAIANIFQIDENYLLIIEYMDSKGQRAYVLNKSKNKLEQTFSFKGKSFIKNTTNYTKSTKLTYEPSRKYLHIAGNENIIGDSNLHKKFIFYDKESQTISYVINNKGELSSAKWINNSFEIDDFYLGNYMHDEPMPMPEPLKTD
jgi:hypothetical protein